MSTAEPLMSVGAILSGRFQIQDFIGNGPTGEVYGVRDLHGPGTFALKLFWPNALSQPEIWSALQQTARTAAGLGADGIARAHDFGIDANCARPFMVTERVSWSSLADRVRLRGRLTPAEVLSALTVLARTLDRAHSVGLVHRDLKPENVFVAPENANWVRVTDFGVALLGCASPPPPGWGGTVGWVSPEAADPNARSTPAMDVFALGLVTFFALSGGALHRAARANPIVPEVLWQELGAELDSASTRARELGASLDPAFDAWFQRAVSPNPDLRFPSVTEMTSAFEAIVRTLFAPQTQNLVAIPGVAVAIAQPLIFQPESQHFGAPQAAPPSASLPEPASAELSNESADTPISSIPGVRKRGAGFWFITGALVCVSLTALGVTALYQQRRARGEAGTTEALARASAADSVARGTAAPITPIVPSASEVSSDAATNTAAAAAVTASALPPANLAPKSAAPATAASRVTAQATPLASPAKVRGAQVQAVSTAVSASKPAPRSTPASGTPAKKKKCGSVFLPCK